MSKCKICGSAGLFNCAKCHYATYCGKECQKIDWRTHKIMCSETLIESKKELPKGYSEVPMENRQHLIDFLKRKYNT